MHTGVKTPQKTCYLIVERHVLSYTRINIMNDLSHIRVVANIWLKSADDILPNADWVYSTFVTTYPEPVGSCVKIYEVEDELLIIPRC